MKRTEKELSRTEMLKLKVSRIQQMANRDPNLEEGVRLKNHDTAREIWASYNLGSLKIENGYFVPAKKTARKGNAAYMKAASKSFKEVKSEYQNMLQKEIKAGKSITAAAKDASKSYKKQFGATPKARWNKVLRNCKGCK